MHSKLQVYKTGPVKMSAFVAGFQSLSRLVDFAADLLQTFNLLWISCTACCTTDPSSRRSLHLNEHQVCVNRGCSVSGLVAQWLGRWIRDQEVASSTPGDCATK